MKIEIQRLVCRMRTLPGISAVLVPNSDGDPALVRLSDLSEIDRSEYTLAGVYDPRRSDFSAKLMEQDIGLARMEGGLGDAKVRPI